MPDSVSDDCPSLAVMDWSSAVTEPVTSAGVPPAPSALPMATTEAPTLMSEDRPSGVVVRPETFWICRTAMSSVGS
jgi:hypothetical protein